MELVTNTVYISLGTNLGNRTANLQQAIQLMNKQVGTTQKVSSIYETPPLGFSSDTYFYNMCIEIKTQLSPEDVLLQLQKIEHEMGRTRNNQQRYSDRNIDLDIIFYNQIIIEKTNIHIPHPRYQSRKFVLEPLYEIAPDFSDPTTSTPLSTLISLCDDTSVLQRTNEKVTF